MNRPPCLCTHRPVRCDSTGCDLAPRGPFILGTHCRVCWLHWNSNGRTPTNSPAPVAAPGALGRSRMAAALACVHKGEPTGQSTSCGECGARQETIPLLACTVHGVCTERVAADKAIRSCKGCQDRQAPTYPEVWPGVADPLPEAELVPMPPRWAHGHEVIQKHRDALIHMLAQTWKPPADRQGRGIITLGGGRFWPGVVVLVKMLRLYSDLPVQIWHRGEEEPVRPSDLDGVPGVSIHDLTALRHRSGTAAPRCLRGWESKTTAVLHCGWSQVLYLDSDAYPVADPAPLLDVLSPEAPFLYWQDLPGYEKRLQAQTWGIDPAEVRIPQVQGGHLLFDVVGFWRGLLLSHWLSQHSDFTYHHGYSDQDCFRLTLHVTGHPYRCLGPAPWIHPAFVLPWGGKPLLVHRCQGKMGMGRDRRTTHLPGDREVWGFYDAMRR